MRELLKGPTSIDLLPDFAQGSSADEQVTRESGTTELDGRMLMPGRSLDA